MPPALDGCHHPHKPVDAINENAACVDAQACKTEEKKSKACKLQEPDLKACRLQITLDILRGLLHQSECVAGGDFVPDLPGVLKKVEVDACVAQDHLILQHIQNQRPRSVSVRASVRIRARSLHHIRRRSAPCKPRLAELAESGVGGGAVV